MTFYNKCSLYDHDCNQNTYCAITPNVSLCCAFIDTPFHPALPSSTPANTNLLSIYIILPFWECCVNGNIWYMTFQTDSFYSAQCPWRRLSTEELMLSKYGAGEDSCKSLGLEGDQASQSQRKSTLNIHWIDGCWSWISNTLVTWWEKLTHWKRPWCWKRLKAKG